MCQRSGRPFIGYKDKLRRKLPKLSWQMTKYHFTDRWQLSPLVWTDDTSSRNVWTVKTWTWSFAVLSRQIWSHVITFPRMKSQLRRRSLQDAHDIWEQFQQCFQQRHKRCMTCIHSEETYSKWEDDADGKQRSNRVFCYQLSHYAFAYAIVLPHVTDNFQVDGVSTEIYMLSSGFWKTSGMAGLPQFLTYHQSAKMSELNRIFNMSYKIHRLVQGNHGVLQERLYHCNYSNIAVVKNRNGGTLPLILYLSTWLK